MNIKAKTWVRTPDLVTQNTTLSLKSDYSRSGFNEISLNQSIIYPTLVNSHDHLIGDWFPKAGTNNPYPTTDIWVEEMKKSPSFLERNKIWLNDGSFQLHQGNAPLITQLGAYKNIFSGCATVQDHAPLQKPEYYKQFPIDVISNFRQCHSLSLGNWWGGKSAYEEWKSTEEKMPFILHLAEGTNEQAKRAFKELEKLDLLHSNTLIIHGIALTREEIKKCAAAGTSICCCPDSNHFLIGKTIDIRSCLEFGVNLVIGTDSTMSGSPNLLMEIRKFKELFPDIPSKEIFKMITSNACRALFIPCEQAYISDTPTNFLAIKQKCEDPFDNLLLAEIDDIQLMIHRGKPIYGLKKYLEFFNVDYEEYTFYRSNEIDRFVIGKPFEILKNIEKILGYPKKLPYLPF